MKTLSLKIFLVSSFLILPIFHQPAFATRVLFIGNSLTYANDLPGLIEDLAKSRDHELQYVMYAPNNYGLFEHAKDARLLRIIKLGHWDWVIIQEQSQRPEADQWQLERDVYPYAAKLSDLVRASNPHANLAFFQTMAHKNGDPVNILAAPELGTYDGAQQRINAAYIEMASRNQGLLVPVGYLWSQVRHERPEIELYADEGHPNLTGSYLAACVFYSLIFHENTAGLPYPAQVDDQSANYFHSLIDHNRDSAISLISTEKLDLHMQINNFPEVDSQSSNDQIAQSTPSPEASDIQNPPNQNVNQQSSADAISRQIDLMIEKGIAQLNNLLQEFRMIIIEIFKTEGMPTKIVTVPVQKQVLNLKAVLVMPKPLNTQTKTFQPTPSSPIFSHQIPTSDY